MRQAATACAVYHEDIEPTLYGRQSFVRAECAAFIAQYACEPTAKELERFVAANHPDRLVDVNVVRPRLTEMAQQGYVERCPKRVCRITGKRVTTWRPSVPPPPGRLF